MRMTWSATLQNNCLCSCVKFSGHTNIISSHMASCCFVDTLHRKFTVLGYEIWNSVSIPNKSKKMFTNSIEVIRKIIRNIKNRLFFDWANRRTPSSSDNKDIFQHLMILFYSVVQLETNEMCQCSALSNKNTCENEQKQVYPDKDGVIFAHIVLGYLMFGVFCHCFGWRRIQSTWLQWPFVINAFKNIKPLISVSHACEQSHFPRHTSAFITWLEISTHTQSCSNSA